MRLFVLISHRHNLLFLLKGDTQPRCTWCGCPLTVTQIIVECPHLTINGVRFYRVLLMTKVLDVVLVHRRVRPRTYPRLAGDILFIGLMGISHILHQFYSHYLFLIYISIFSFLYYIAFINIWKNRYTPVYLFLAVHVLCRYAGQLELITIILLYQFSYHTP